MTGTAWLAGGWLADRQKISSAEGRRDLTMLTFFVPPLAADARRLLRPLLLAAAVSCRSPSRSPTAPSASILPARPWQRSST